MSRIYTLRVPCKRCGVQRAKITVDTTVEQGKQAVCQVCNDIERLQGVYEAADAAGDFWECERVAGELIQLQQL